MGYRSRDSPQGDRRVPSRGVVGGGREGGGGRPSRGLSVGPPQVPDVSPATVPPDSVVPVPRRPAIIGRAYRGRPPRATRATGPGPGSSVVVGRRPLSPPLLTTPPIRP